MSNLDRSTLLITGASSGIGRQLAIDYAKLGFRVIALGRNQQNLSSLKNSFPEQIETLSVELTATNAISDISNFLSSHCRRLDLVILNAGTCEYVDISDFNADLFRRVFDTNLMATVNSLQACLPFLKASVTQDCQSVSLHHARPKLVLVGSLAAEFPFTRAAAYGASKAAIAYMADSLRVDLAKIGIDVSLVSPGFVATPLTAKNTFEMPTIIDVENASRRIRAGIDKNKLTIDFPKRLSWVLKLLAKLPCSIKHKIALRMAASESN